MRIINTKKQNGFTIIEILLMIVIIGIVGFAGYFIYSNTKNDSKGTDVSNNTSYESMSNLASNENQSEGLVTTVYTDLEGTSLSVQHASNWEVERSTMGGDPGGVESPAVSIRSDQGNYLHLWSPDGFGGDCGGPNSIRYTLTKKIPTQIPGVVFSEYTTDNPDYPLDTLSAETYFEFATDAHKQLNEGESNTDTCTNGVGYYSIVKGVYITITKDPNPRLSSKVPYAELKNDTEFIKMLSSLTEV